MKTNVETSRHPSAVDGTFRYLHLSCLLNDIHCVSFLNAAYMSQFKGNFTLEAVIYGPQTNEF
jgi:hypothetical protein